MRKMKETMIIIGSGAAGLSAALEFAKNGTRSILVSDMPSERAQSVMAEGGINAAVDTQEDSPELHAEETMKAGRYIADSKAVHQMTKEAPKIIKDLFEAGMAFTLNENKISLDFHVIVAYGVSIRAVSDNLIANVKYKVEAFTGIEVENINILVEGVRVID